VFEEVTHDLRMILRMVGERESQPTAAILDGRALQSTPESGGRAGYDGAKKKRCSKMHLAVDTLGHLLALKVTASVQVRGSSSRITSVGSAPWVKRSAMSCRVGAAFIGTMVTPTRRQRQAASRFRKTITTLVRSATGCNNWRMCCNSDHSR
jgi:DDE family transposase